MTQRVPLTLLLIDDCAVDRYIYRQYLQQNKLYTYEILEFETAKQAITWCEQHTPDVILLDYLLPDDDGLEFLQQLRKNINNQQSAVIMLTGAGDEMIAVSAMKNGAQDYLVKNHFSPKALQSAIHNAVERMHLARDLEKSREQQQLISKITLQIRQSLKLEEILHETATQIRQFLKADRVLIYQFQADMNGSIVAESVLGDWTLALGKQIHDTCFQQGDGKDCHYGQKCVIDDIYQAGLSDSYLHFLEQFEVKAYLVVPIFVNTQLWGLLIAQQCSTSRHWQSVEVDLLEQLAIQVAIAIQQASAYEQLQTELAQRQQIEKMLQQLNQELEAKFEKRTAALKQSEERWQLVLRGSNDGIWDWDIKTNQVFFSTRWKQMRGFAEHEINNNLEERLSRIHPDDYDRVMQAIADHFAQKTPFFQEEYRVQHKNGRHIWISDRGQALWDDAGNVTRMSGSETDITQRKIIELVLQESERRYATLTKAVPVVIYQLDATYNCIYANDRWSEMMGRPLEAAFGMGWLETIHPDDSDRLARQWYQWIQTYQPGQTYCVEGRCLRPSGDVIWFYCQVLAETDANGMVIGYIGTMMDITERKQAEAKVKHTNEALTKANTELARATRLKDEFLANMSHELRTPLNAILGMSEGLQEAVFGSINERQIKAISTIERSGRHLLELINDILDLSKIESGKLELQLGDIWVKSLCDASLAFIKQMASKKNIRLNTHIAHNIRSIQADERRLRQVLINLLSNAVKFTPEGGSVTLEVRVEEAEKQAGAEVQRCRGAEVQGCRSAGVQGCSGGVGEVNSALFSSSFNLCFDITDTGIGIAAEEIGKLFQPFIQLDSSLNRQYSGTGLGLALVKRIVNLHGGTVSVTSEVGQGSCFHVCIPYVKGLAQGASEYLVKPITRTQLQTTIEKLQNSASSEVQTQMGVSEVALTHPLILIAEDNQANIDTMSGYLESRGYDLILANNGQQAIDVALAQCPELIVMDIQMPGMDGLEAIRRLRDHQQFFHTPIIALTALAMTGDRETCLAAGANEYLTKPVKLKQLVTTIQQLLGR
ncbi:response regulator [Nostoc sp. FACHB-152]|uniref:response regulator n=1 Tax=Nostoc sp. FACHB-152 TaxID=2692837 RepID=UPI001681F446|nr:response regulator [Nostoc sp. FACHB-152]MBD2449893.1 response regulator [Nostoc sp. FACHB-152]